MKCQFYIQMILALVFFAGCQSTFVDVGVGYSRYEFDEIRSTVTIDSKPVETKLTHADAFTTKLRTGGEFIEAIPQLRAGMELRGSFGGASDTNREGIERAYSEIILLLVGGGPFIAWQQKLGEILYIEGGAFFGGYTVGVHQKGRVRYGSDFNVESEGGVGWSGGAYGKIGLQESDSLPCKFAMEFAYEKGEWDFGGDIGEPDVDSYTFLLSSEIDF